MVRQLGVMIGIALSVALGVAVVLWSQTPSLSPLYGNLSQKDAPEVMDALQQAGIEVKYAEARDGHNWENWRDRLRDALSWAFPGPLWVVYE